MRTHPISRLRARRALTLCVLVALGLPAGALAAPPANDDFANAITISGDPATTSGTTEEATAESNESTADDGEWGGSVWFRWTAPSTGRASLVVCGPVNVAAFTGTQVDALQQRSQYVELQSCGANTGRVHEFDAQAGQEYRLGVAAATDPGQAFTLRVGLGTLPENARAPRIVGTLARGRTLQADPGEWSGAATFSYSWIACTTPVGHDGDCEDRVGTGPTYTPTAADVDRYLRLVVAATNDVGTRYAESPLSERARVVETPPDSDGDGVLDPDDECPRRSAPTGDGCPAARDVLVPSPPAPDTLAPVLASLALRGGARSARRTVSVAVDERAIVQFAVERRAGRGRRARWRRVAGEATRLAPAGGGAVSVPLRAIPDRALRPASYRVVVTAIDVAGNTSPPLRKAFKSTARRGR